MKQFIFAGILYLIVISIVLTIKPSFMFTEEGVWKEFGIGRNPETHTWMPFWLFAILSALISYILVTIVMSFYATSGSSMKNRTMEMMHAPASAPSINFKTVNAGPDVDTGVFPILTAKSSRMKPSYARGNSVELPEGYYILNSEATVADGGVPKYIFLGKGLPSD
jgi:hypothetical protein